jgi:hypothetical protein
MFHVLLKVFYECYFQVLRQIAGWKNPHPAAIVVSFLLQDGQGGLPFPLVYHKAQPMDPALLGENESQRM